MEKLPEDQNELALMLRDILVDRATGGYPDENLYRQLRSTFYNQNNTKELLPTFVRTNLTLNSFWQFIKVEADNYSDRRKILHKAFTPLLDYLDSKDTKPSDDLNTETLQSFDLEGVNRVWQKAIERRKTDPEGAITVARTLLETVCKKILDEFDDADYRDDDELPKLYKKTAEKLNLAPDQHTEDTFKSILGSASNIVNGIGTLRNKISDAHGKGGKPVIPSERHANLVVNLSGATATFLVETFNARR